MTFPERQAISTGRVIGKFEFQVLRAAKFSKTRLSFALRNDVLMRVLIRHQLTVILALGLLVSVQSISQETPTGALQLELVRDGVAQSVRPLFKVEMHNKTARPLILFLGWNVGEKNYAGEIKFSLTDVSGRTRHLVKRNPAYVAGQMAPYIVTIPEGGAFELPSIDLADYWSYEPKVAVLALPAGRYSLIAEYTGHNPNDDFTPKQGQPAFHQYTQNFWIGAVHSNVMAFALTLPIGHQDAN